MSVKKQAAVLKRTLHLNPALNTYGRLGCVLCCSVFVFVITLFTLSISRYQNCALNYFKKYLASKEQMCVPLVQLKQIGNKCWKYLFFSYKQWPTLQMSMGRQASKDRAYKYSWQQQSFFLNNIFQNYSHVCISWVILLYRLLLFRLLITLPSGHVLVCHF